MKKPATLGRHGVEEWYMQRVSAVVLLLLAPVVLWGVVVVAHGDVSQVLVLAWLASTPVRLAHSLFAFAVLIHAYIGCKIILEDYLHQPMLRMLTLAALQVVAVVALVFWISRIWLQ